MSGVGNVVRFRLSTAVAMAFCGLLYSAGLLAQVMPIVAASKPEPSEAPVLGEPSPNDVREFMRLLADERIRQWLSQRAAEDLEGAMPGESEGPGLQEWLATRLDAIEENANRVAAAWAAPGEHLAAFQGGWSEGMDEGETLRSMVYVIVFLILGTGLEWLYWRYAWEIRRRIELAAQREPTHSVRGTTLRALLATFGIALFAAGTIGGFLIFEWKPLVEIVVITLLLSVVSIRLLNAAALFALCPRVPALRPIPIETPTARFLYWWLMAIVVVACVGGLAAEASAEMMFVPQGGIIMSSATSTLVALMLIAAIWHGRMRYARTQPREAGRARRVRVSEFAPMLATSLVLIVWILWLVGARAFMWTLVIVAAFIVADWCLRLGVAAFAETADGGPRIDDGTPPEPIDEETPSEPVAEDEAAPVEATDEATGDASAHDKVAAQALSDAQAKLARRRLYAPVLERFIRFILVVASVLLLGTTWGLDLGELSASTSLAGELFEAGVDILVAVLIADMIWVWAKTAIDARMADYVPPEPGHAPGPEARLATLLPLIRKILMVTLLVMVVLVTLSSLGVNVGPLLAGAGVVGIAIGFGAQTLVRDIVSGIFFLLDDAFRVGEYIEVGDLRGLVESISIRSLRLRHHRGPVHTVPFGEMKSLTNHSRDWVIMKLEFRVPFGTDLKLVKKLVTQIGKDLEDHEEIGPSIIEPLKSQDVRRMEEFNMVVGVKFMTKPGEQWQMRKEVYQRVRDAFDRNGITFAERNVKVEVVGGENMSPQVREAAVGAAQQVIEEQIGEPGAAKANP